MFPPRGRGLGAGVFGGFGLFSSPVVGFGGVLKCKETQEGWQEPSPCSPSGTMKIQFKTTPVL